MVALVFTLLGTGTTLCILNGLLSPLKAASKALRVYVAERTIPNLSTHHPDEAGQLLYNLQQTIVRLENTQKQRQDLTALLSYNLRSPMNNALVICEILKMAEDKDMVQLFVAQLEREMKHQLDFLGEVLEMMRHDEIDLPYNKLKPTSLNWVIEQAIEQTKILLEQKKIDLLIDVDAGVSIFPTLFQHALQNLLSYSIKFSKKEGRIEVIGQKVDDLVKISIKDHGIGFKPNDADRIFDRFTSKGKIGTKGKLSAGLGFVPHQRYRGKTQRPNFC